MNLVKILVLFFVICFVGTASAQIAQLDVETLPKEVFLSALKWKESKNGLSREGDQHKKDSKFGMAYGILQIREGVTGDLSKFLGIHYSVKDYYGNDAVSLEIFEKYIALWKKRLGKKKMTYEEMAKTWNGGPSGPNRTTSNAYWEDVHDIMVCIAEGKSLLEYERKKTLNKTKITQVVPKKNKRVVVNVNLTEITRPRQQLAAN